MLSAQEEEGLRSSPIDSQELSQKLAQPGSLLRLEIGGTTHDRFNVTGATPLRLGGTMEVVLWQGFLPSGGAAFPSFELPGDRCIKRL